MGMGEVKISVVEGVREHFILSQIFCLLYVRHGCTLGSYAYSAELCRMDFSLEKAELA
jgi:hypothetical protein